MSKNFLDTTRADQDILRSKLWDIFKQRNQSIQNFSHGIGIAPLTLSNFFRGAKLSRISEDKVKQFLNNHKGKQ